LEEYISSTPSQEALPHSQFIKPKKITPFVLQSVLSVIIHTSSLKKIRQKEEENKNTIGIEVGI
jgi:hypothetical protein